MAGPRAREAARAHYHHMAEALRDLERALQSQRLDGVIPEAWHAIALDRGAGRKTKVTMYVEDDVLKFFRATGRGYMTRIGDVLRTFMHARLAGMVQGPEAVVYAPQPDAAAPASRALAGVDAALGRSRAERQADFALLRAEIARREREGEG